MHRSPISIARKREAGSAVTTLLILVGVASLALFGFLGYRWWTGEERVIRARLDNLAVLLSPADGGELATVARIGQLRGYFAPDVHVRIGTDEVVSREALLALLARWQPPAKGVKLEFVDVSVTVEADTALASLTAKISNTDAASSEDPVADAREGVITLHKSSGEWVIGSVASTDTLQK
jgi:hypothetical protein